MSCEWFSVDSPTLLKAVSLLIGCWDNQANGQYSDHLVGQLTTQLTLICIFVGHCTKIPLDKCNNICFMHILRKNIARGTLDPGIASLT